MQPLNHFVLLDPEPVAEQRQGLLYTPSNYEPGYRWGKVRGIDDSPERPTPGVKVGMRVAYDPNDARGFTLASGEEVVLVHESDLFGVA